MFAKFRKHVRLNVFKYILYVTLNNIQCHKIQEVKIIHLIQASKKIILKKMTISMRMQFLSFHNI